MVNINVMKINITEQQHNRLFEAMRPEFRLDCLISCKSYNRRVEYCKQMLGNPIGNGSSRMVFQIDDETCLKLAKNEKGVAQNMEEMRIASDGFISYIPKVFNGSDEENGLWVISQYVIPAKIQDFEKVLGISFYDVAKFAEFTDKRCDYRRASKEEIRHADNVVSKLYDKYADNDLAIELFNDIHDLKANYDQFVGDLCRIQNWGMVRENGQTFMVMLDSGFSEEICKKYYR